MRTLVFSVLGFIGLTAGIRAQSVADQLKQRTGQSLREAKSAPGAFTLPPGVSLVGELSATQAVATALWNNAAFQAALARLDLSRADLVEAGQFRNPSVSMLLPVGPKPFESLLAWPIEEIFQRGRRVRAAQLGLDATAADVVRAGLDLARDVRMAHTEVWLRERRAATLQESADTGERIAQLVATRRANGDATGREVNDALADSRSASALRDLATNDLVIARSHLRWLLGMPGDSPAFAVAAPAKSRTLLPSDAALIGLAMTYRPDLRAAELDVEARAAKAKWERSRVLSLLAPTLSVKDVGTAGLRAGPGLNFDIPLSRNKGKVSRADAETVEAALTYAALKAQVEREVRDARQAAQSAEAAAVLVAQIREAVEASIALATRAYQGGEISQLDLLEATRRRYDVTVRDVEATAAIERRRAELERAIGRTL